VQRAGAAGRQIYHVVLMRCSPEYAARCPSMPHVVEVGDHDKHYRRHGNTKGRCGKHDSCPVLAALENRHPLRLGRFYLCIRYPSPDLDVSIWLCVDTGFIAASAASSSRDIAPSVPNRVRGRAAFRWPFICSSIIRCVIFIDRRVGPRLRNALRTSVRITPAHSAHRKALRRPRGRVGAAGSRHYRGRSRGADPRASLFNKVGGLDGRSMCGFTLRCRYPSPNSQISSKQ
jgi:hypothetical protein